MEEDNKVSFWLGKFDSQENLNSFIADLYDEDGDLIDSEFMTATGIEYYDGHKREVLYSNNKLSEHMFLDFSYASSFMENINITADDLENYNSMIFLYDFNFEGDIDSKQIKFIGVFDYDSSIESDK